MQNKKLSIFNLVGVMTFLLTWMISLRSECKLIPSLDHASHPFGFGGILSENRMNGKVFNSYSNYMVVSASKNFNVNLQYSHTYLKNESLPFVPNQKVSGNLIRVTTVSSHFQVLAPHGRCCQPESNDNQPCKERTSDTAKVNECIVATNAGFFDVAHGYCLGRVV